MQMTFNGAAFTDGMLGIFPSTNEPVGMKVM
jgi:hypothetical protein